MFIDIGFLESGISEAVKFELSPESWKSQPWEEGGGQMMGQQNRKWLYKSSGKEREEEETERGKNPSLFLQQKLLCLQAFICQIKAESGTFVVGLDV